MLDSYHRSSTTALVPWKEISAAYSDDELTAIYLYLNGLAPIQRRSP